MKQPKVNELAPHIPDNGPFCVIAGAVVCEVNFIVALDLRLSEIWMNIKRT